MLQRLCVSAAFSVLLVQSCFGEGDEACDRVASYQLTQRIDDVETSLEMLKQSSLNWSNPVFGTTDGRVFIWTDNHCPAVIMKTYKTKSGRWFEQVRSLTTAQVQGRDKDGKIFWSPNAGAKPMELLTKAPVPGETPIQRLVQMKALHRRFVVTGDVENAGGKQQLRAYPRPIYRYSNDDKGVVDGAVLGFVQGTGLDVVLVLEARKTSEGPRWFYRLAAVGIFAIEVINDGKVVWQEGRRTAANTRPTDIYDGRRLAETAN